MSDLRYALQSRVGRRWRTAKTFTPERLEFRVLEKMAQIMQRERGGEWRVLLMPFNVLAVSVQ